MTELREHLRAVICEWWGQVEEAADVEQSLELADIQEQLEGRGVEVAEDTLRDELLQLGGNNYIQAAMSPSAGGGLKVHGVTSREFCE